MFSAKILILIILALKLIYDGFTLYLSNKQRKLPLPEEVADIFDEDRYNKYLGYVADKQKLYIIFTGVGLVTDMILLFSPIYSLFENICKQNVYLVFLLTFVVFWIIGLITDIIRDYITTFKIEEKYGLNKKTIKEFVKDVLLEQVLEIVVTCGLMMIIIFIGEHMNKWTNGFTVGYLKSFLLCLAIAAVIGVFLVAATLFSYFILKVQYTFTPLEEGELRDNINKLQESSKKKVKQIYVYDESKKSTRKNAFLLKLFWHREFGIADNFIDGNSDRELLAVLSHEIGHLKHKKDFFNFLSYARFVVIFALVVFLIANPAPILFINGWVRESFGISVNNYYIWMIVFSSILEPVMAIVKIFSTYRIRREEYEADREAVKNGYAEELIKTFKTLSSDELINVNPHPLIEFLEYDHPGMYRRIKAINEADKKRKEGEQA